MTKSDSIVQAELVTDRSDMIIHILFLSFAMIVLGASFVLKSDGLSRVYLPGGEISFPRTCSSRIIFGIDCPGCGMTRAFIAISDGRFCDAWWLNRASFLLYAFVGAQIPWHSLQLARLWQGRPTLFWPWIYSIPIAVVVLMLINWVLKLSGV